MVDAYIMDVHLIVILVLSWTQCTDFISKKNLCIALKFVLIY